MHCSHYVVGAVLASALAVGGGIGRAQATQISIGLATNGGAVTTVATDTATPGNAGVIGIGFGGYQVNNISATATPLLTSPNMDTSALDVSGGTSNVLDVFITESGLTSPSSAFNAFSSLTSNVLTSGWTVELAFYIDPADGIYSTPAAGVIDSNTFSAIGTQTSTSSISGGAGPYSITAEYVITPNGSLGASNATADLTNVPEPATFALLGIAAVGATVLRRNRQARSV